MRNTVTSRSRIIVGLITLVLAIRFLPHAVMAEEVNPILVFSYDVSRVEAEAKSSLKINWMHTSVPVGGEILNYVNATKHDLQIDAKGKTVTLPGMLFIEVSATPDKYRNITDGPERMTLEDAVNTAHRYADVIEAAGWVKGTKKFDSPLSVVALTRQSKIQNCHSYDEFMSALVKTRQEQISSADKYEQEARINANVGVWRDGSTKVRVHMQARPGLDSLHHDPLHEKIYFVNVEVFDGD